MLKKIVWLLLIFSVFSASIVIFSSDTSIETFLELIFDSKDFGYETYSMGYKEMIFAYLYRPSSNLFYRAIIFDKASPFTPLLYIT